MATLQERASKGNGFVFSATVEMSVKAWHILPPNPRQRDTEHHAKRAMHLQVPDPTHAKVSAGRLPDGQLIKLDGHSRDYLWDKGDLLPPPVLQVDIWDCDDLNAIMDIYVRFDNRGAAESTADQMYGAIKECGLVFESELLKSQKFAAAISSAYELLFGQQQSRTTSTYDKIKYWVPELKLLDECSPSRKRFSRALVTATLITLRRYGPQAQEFWTEYASGRGTKIDNEMDAVQALSERMGRIRMVGAISGRGNLNEIVRISLSAFDSHRIDYSYKVDSSGVKRLQNNGFVKWLTTAKATMRSW